MSGVWTYGLAAAVGTLALAVAIIAVVLYRSGERHRFAMQAMQQDLRALCNAAVGVGERVNRLELQLKEIAARQEQLGVRQDRLDQGVGDDRSYDQAIKMVKKGASVDDLVEVCGLARGEAELIAMMHRLSA